MRLGTFLRDLSRVQSGAHAAFHRRDSAFSMEARQLNPKRENGFGRFIVIPEGANLQTLLRDLPPVMTCFESLVPLEFARGLGSSQKKQRQAISSPATLFV